jgi:GH43 family beta-xylosidase
MRKSLLSLLITVSLLLSWGCGDEIRPLVTPDGTWQKQGTIMSGGAGEQYSVQEPSVLYENGTFEMWFTCGWSIEAMCYATSADGIHWTRYNSGMPLIYNVAHGFVTKIGSTYYYYAAILPSSTNFGRWRSTDKVTWVQDASKIFPATRKGWESGQRGNIYVWISEGIWYALYEALGEDKNWRIGLATSSDGLTWTESSGNPRIQYGVNAGCGGPEVHFVNGAYYVWVQCSQSAFGPTQIYRFRSSDLKTFTRSPLWPVLAQTTIDEGMSASEGQVADASMVEVNGRTYMFYDATDNQNPKPDDGIHLKLAIAPMTMAQLVTTNEGAKGPSSSGGNDIGTSF